VFGKDKIHGLFLRLQGRRLGMLGFIPASLLGIASPLCMYGTIPMAASFSEKGMRDDWLAAFMMSSILLNPQLLVYSMALGAPALAVRFFSCFLCGIAAGLCVRLFCRNRRFFDFSGFTEAAGRDPHPTVLLRLLKSIWRNIRVTGLYFLIGVLLTAAYQRYVPAGLVAHIFGRQRGFGVLTAAAAFMITGPATKITNLGAVKIILGTRRFALYLAFVVLFACAAGGLTSVAGAAP
jgi:uncharacterized membrane protein YraQ (UPF0718 family)